MSDYIPLSDRGFSDVAGKRVKIVFQDIKSALTGIPINSSKLKYVEGYIENFYPGTGVILNDEEFGFNIIPMKSIVQLLEVIDEEEIESKETQDEYYIVTYRLNNNNNDWKSTRFTDKDKALNYYNRMKGQYEVVYFK